MYYVNNHRRQIVKFVLSSNETDEIEMDIEIGTVVSLAVDWVNDTLVIADSTSESIWIVHPKTRNFQSLLTNISNPRSILLQAEVSKR